jgi:sodium transport system permease protein
MREVFLKELREMFRDKRVRSTAFLGPIILIFGLLFLLSSVIGNLAKPQSVKVHLLENTPAAWVKRFESEKYQVQFVKSEAEGRKLITGGKARTLVVFDGPAEAKVQKVRVLFDESEQLGQIGKERILGVFRVLNEKKLAGYLKGQNVTPEMVSEIAPEAVNIGVTKDKGAGEFLVGFLPYLIVIWAFYGGMSSASDLVAGEKERSTLETLLISPVSRTHIVLGKIFALGVICFLSSLSSLVGLGIFVGVRPPGSEMMLNKGLGINGSTVVLAIALLIPLVLMMASLLILISSYAKNAREAQTYLSLGSFVVIMPAMFSQFIGLTEFGKAAWVDYVPVLNVANHLRLALLSKPDFAGAGVAIIVNLVLALLAGWIAVRMFHKETIITRA